MDRLNFGAGNLRYEYMNLYNQHRISSETIE
jgi:hypothetical protein